MPDYKLTKRSFLKAAAVAALVPSASSSSVSEPTPGPRPPNVVLICADDLGWGDPIYSGSAVIGRRIGIEAAAEGDLTPNGPYIRTPNLARMAKEGVRLSRHNSTSPVCSPSRASLMTGRYSVRVGVPDVLFPDSKVGLSGSETTIAETLKARGYRTMCVGKWHLGSQPASYPTNRGFDEYYGLLCSNDAKPLQLMQNTEVIEQPADLATLTPRYVNRAVKFIEQAGNEPFFLYFAHFLPHVPLVVSEKYRGVSGFGIYGDAVEEIDGSVGRILAALEQYGLDQNTLVMVTSDHGPWYQGNSLNLHGRKGETFEGGVRVPFVARFPGRIPASHVSQGFSSHLDILPTIARLCDANLPEKPLDGIDISPLLLGTASDIERELSLYFDFYHLQCARSGTWKLHVARYNCAAWAPPPTEGKLNLPLPKPELYNLAADPSERYDVSDIHPDIVAEIQDRIEELIPGFPEEVQNAWQKTNSLKVELTPPGAYPVLKTP